MKILLLGHASSIHTLNWVRSIANGSNEILLISLVPAERAQYETLPGVTVEDFGMRVRTGSSSLLKLKYLRALANIRQSIEAFDPDILHAHFATSYGLLGALSGFHPLVVSVWGSDVYRFPNISLFHREVLRFIFSKADRILSTSCAMADEVRLYTKKRVDVTPFGIDTRRFNPEAGNKELFPGELVIGTIKALESIYGQDYLIRAFKAVIDANPGLPLRLLLVGSGSAESKLKALTNRLGIGERVSFAGIVANEEIHRYHGRIDIFATLSDADSFGVTVLESQACGKPVVVTDVGGLPEVVENGITGFIVPTKDPAAAAEAIDRLVRDPDLRSRMGAAGRQRVEKLFGWDACASQRDVIYNSLCRDACVNHGRYSGRR